MIPRLRREVGRALAARRRLLAAGLAAGAVALALTALRPAPPPTVRVLSAAQDLSAGTRLDRSHLTTVALPPAAVPEGALRARQDATGRLLATPMRAGEPLTDLRLVGPALLAGYGPDMVAAPVRVADAGVARLLRPGDRVDVLAADANEESTASSSDDGDEGDGDDGDDGDEGDGDEDGPPARVVAPAAAVVAVPVDTEPDFSSEGALVLLATTPGQAARLAQSAVTSRLSVVLRP